MLKLYFSKGSSALAAHILLEDVGQPYEAEEVSIPAGQHQTPAFLGLNPKGRLPVLRTPDGALTENPAILEYIAAAHPNAGLIPKGLFQQSQARSLSAYLCATAHVAFAHKQRGARWATSEHAIKAMQERVAMNLTDCAGYLETQFGSSPWAIGQTYSYCDPYLFLMGRWMAASGLDIAAFPKLAAHSAAMRARPATQAAMAAHQID